jgi:hypothetical protein
VYFNQKKFQLAGQYSQQCGGLTHPLMEPKVKGSNPGVNKHFNLSVNFDFERGLMR